MVTQSIKNIPFHAIGHEFILHSSPNLSKKKHSVIKKKGKKNKKWVKK